MTALTEELKQTLRVEPNGTVFVDTVSTIKKDNVIMGNFKHVDTLVPGSDVSNFSLDVQNICAALWTEDKIAEYKAAEEARLAQID